VVSDAESGKYPVRNRCPLNVILIKGRSTYDATRVFIDEIAEAFRRAGDVVQVVDLAEEPDELGYIARRAAGGSYDLIFSIGLFGELHDEAGRSLSQIVGAPHVIQYVDYPLSHYPRLMSTDRGAAILVVDPTHVTAIRSVLGEDRFRHIAFSPHGGVGEPAPLPASASAWADARPIPLLFPGTFYKPGPPMWAKARRTLQTIFDAAVETCLRAEFVPALTALDQAIDDHGAALSPAARRDLRINAFAVHERVRQHRRYEMLRAMAKTGLPIQVFGEGYDRDLYRFKNITYGGPKTFGEIVGLMGQSRLVMNINANFGHGSHERPLSAMLAGAVAVSDYSRFYEEAFGEALVQLRWRNLEGDLARLGEVMRNPDLAFEIAVNGRKAALAHRWDNRIAAIVEAAQASATTSAPG
jgi:hypothetical protein